MGITEICFGTSCNCASLYEISTYAETKYQLIFKKLVSFLYNHPNFSFSFTFYGPWFQWVEKHHPEFLTILSELIARKQVEILGGGFFNPIFPFLLPVDRVGQTEALTTSIRKILGKRPRGIYLNDGIWDPCCISGFKSCGLEYVLLDSTVLTGTSISITENLPQVVEEQGKAITVVPVCVLGEQTQETTSSVYDLCRKIADGKSQCTSPLLYFHIEENLIPSLLDSGWLEQILSVISQNQKNIEFNIPSRSLKNNSNDRIKTFIPAGLSSNASQWCHALYKNEKSITAEKQNQSSRYTVRDFLLTYSESLNLYSRMIYTCVILNQCRGDKMRKKNAREKIWEAQCGSSYIYTGSAGCSDQKARQNAYTCLLQAEKLSREANGFSSSVTSYDFNADSRREYVCQFPLYNAFVSQIYGDIFEFDLMQNTWNYSGASQRVFVLDRMVDKNQKKLFVDYLFEIPEFARYKNSLCAENNIFTKAGYSELNFDRSKQEISLKSIAPFGQYNQEVSLRKKYVMTDDGIKVQYILKNESHMHIKAIFAVESTLSLENDLKDCKVEIISSDEHNVYPADFNIHQEASVSVANITDCSVSASFLFEPNEDAGICVQPLYVKRKFDENILEIQEGITSVLFWNIDLEAGFETEKTINMRLFLSKKTSLKSRKKSLTV